MVAVSSVGTQFQSTLPRGERHSAQIGSSGDYAFQSTLPRGERLLRPPFLQLHCVISIHAPARGATHHRGFTQQDHAISIHAPARGATSDDLAKDTSNDNFNPRSREGSDDSMISRCYSDTYFNPRSREGSDVVVGTAPVNMVISIHAPARGATHSC